MIAEKTLKEQALSRLRRRRPMYNSPLTLLGLVDQRDRIFQYKSC